MSEQPVADEAGSPNPAGRPRSVVLVLGATALAAASSFLVLLIVAPALGPEQYAVFSVYWAALFMVVGVLFGVQQETTRAVAETAGADGDRESAGGVPESRGTAGAMVSPMRFAAAVGLVLLVVVTATGPFWSTPLFGEGHTSWTLPLAVAVAAYVGVAALNGVLAGSGAWGPFAAIPIIDGVLRLLLVAIVLWQDWGGIALAWAVAIPFPVSLIAVLVWKQSFVRRLSRVPGGYRSLAANSSRTMLASAATAVLVNGFPVVLSLFGGAEKAELGAVVLALTLTRAPILVPLTALQSMLIARLSAPGGTGRRFLLLVFAELAGLTTVIALGVGLWGEAVLAWVFGPGFAVDGWLLAGLVVASGCLGVLTVTGAATLASNRHNAFAGGWVIAAVLSVLGVALLPGDIGLRTVIALIAGPLAGAACHLALRGGVAEHSDN